MKNIHQYKSLIILTVLSSLLFGACSSKSETATPTISAEQVQTQAVATFSMGLTQTAIALPTNTPSPTNTTTPTTTNTPAEPLPTITSVLPTSSCYSLAFLSDVTIPDNTDMIPGEEFTKTWEVWNNGSCVWDSGFKLKFTSGDSLGGSTLILTKDIDPGSTTELSVFMTAPSESGSYQGNWRMSNSDGAYFGDEMYVVINVTGSALTVTSSPSPATSTPTATVTPAP